jgi:hypothetical protein
LYVIKKNHNNKVIHKISRFRGFSSWVWLKQDVNDELADGPMMKQNNSGSNLRDPLKSWVLHHVALGLVCVCVFVLKYQVFWV